MYLWRVCRGPITMTWSEIRLREFVEGMININSLQYFKGGGQRIYLDEELSKVHGAFPFVTIPIDTVCKPLSSAMMAVVGLIIKWNTTLNYIG